MHTIWISILASYLFGALPSGLLIARARGVNIREVGSGNIGATNVFRMVGRGWGILTLVIDGLKGYLPTVLLPLITDHREAGFALICGCAAIAGHNWPVYLRFRGGKGVATSAGVLLGVAPAAAGIGLAMFAVVFALTRYVSVGSMTAALSIPAWAWWTREPGEPLLMPLVLTGLGVLILFTHRSNLRRLVKGQESKIPLGRTRT